MSNPPNVFLANANMLSMSADRVTSTRTAAARPPAFSIAATVSADPASFTSATTIAAPSLASRCAVARPIPDPAPVIIATLPSMFIALLQY